VAGRAFPIVIAAPSGAGKTSLARALVANDETLEFSISATTRAPRPGERDGHDYYFVDDAEFERMIRTKELLEWAEVHGRRYGTPRKSIQEPLSRGRPVVLDIDVQGARQVRSAFPQTVLIFVLPPSARELHRRLAGRGSEGGAQQQKRLNTAWQELGAAPEFDYIIVNDEFDRALATLRAIVLAERHRQERTDGLAEQINGMRDQLADILKRSS
jgi:guanylate kinase